jgi:hypothetical protein
MKPERGDGEGTRSMMEEILAACRSPLARNIFASHKPQAAAARLSSLTISSASAGVASSCTAPSPPWSQRHGEAHKPINLTLQRRNRLRALRRRTDRIAIGLDHLDQLVRQTNRDRSDVLNTKLLGAPRQEFIELRLGGPDDLVLQHLYQPVTEV